MSPDILSTAGVILVVVPTIEFGGLSLLRFIRRHTPGYLDNPVRQSLFRAGHAHAGVLVILALIGLLYLDASDLTGPTRRLVSLCLVAALALATITLGLSLLL